MFYERNLKSVVSNRSRIITTNMLKAICEPGVDVKEQVCEQPITV